MTNRFVCGVLVAAAVGLSASRADALAIFKKAFEAKYADKKTLPDYNRVVRKAGCFVCHRKGEPGEKVSKDERNAYGDELAKLIEGDANARLLEAKEAGNGDAVKALLLEELDAAMKAAEEIDNADGVAYGELIKDHKLPVPLPAKPSDQAAKKTAENATEETPKESPESPEETPEETPEESTDD